MSGPPIVSGAGPAGGDTLAALKSGRITGDGPRLRAATRLLEASFYQELLKVMRQTIPEGGALPAGNGQDMFEGLLDQWIADAGSSKTDMGIGSALYKHFLSVLGPTADAPDAPEAAGETSEP